MTNIKCLRLINGEEIVANVESIEGGVILHDPAALIMQQDNGRPSMGLADYLPLTDSKKITIAVDHVLFVYDPNVSIKNAWSSMFGSGIVVAQRDNIVPFSK